jgi:DNA-binding PadR family transcriptional regulator
VFSGLSKDLQISILSYDKPLIIMKCIKQLKENYLKKTGISPEDWILISLINASERYGIDIHMWYAEERPNELDVSYEQFSTIIDSMETEGLIKKSSYIPDEVIGGWNYCLTDKGKKEAIKLKRRLNFNDYYSIISKFPELELKERIQRLEAFIVYLISLSIPVILNNQNLLYITNPTLSHAISLITLFFFLLISYYFVFNVSEIIFYWIMGLQRDTLWIYKEWLWNNKNKITYPVPALVIILILYVVYTMNLVSWQLMVWGVILFLITQIAINYNRIVSYIQTKIWGNN